MATSSITANFYTDDPKAANKIVHTLFMREVHMFNLNKMFDTLKTSHIRVHIPRSIPQFKNPSEECDRRAVMRQASGNARLAFGRYVTQEQMDSRFERIIAAEI